MKIQFQTNHITVFESALYRTCSAVIELNNAILVIDPNWLPIEIAFIQSYIDIHYKLKEQYLLFTHSDYDHILGWRAFPDAKIIASEAFVYNPAKSDIIQQIHDFDNEFYIHRPYEIDFPKVDFVIKKNYNTLNISGFDMIFFNAKGHVSDGLFTIIPDLNLWIAGDYLSDIEIPMIDQSFEEYKITLDLANNLIQEYPINYLITGHGETAKNKDEILRRIQNDKMYLEFILSEKSTNYTNISDHLSKYSLNPTLKKIHQKNLQMVDKMYSRKT